MSQGNSSRRISGFGYNFFGGIGFILWLVVAITLGVLIGNLLTLYILYRYLGGLF